MKGWPGLTIWVSAARPMISQLPARSVPANVYGLLMPAIGHTVGSTGMPDRHASNRNSAFKSVTASGESTPTAALISGAGNDRPSARISPISSQRRNQARSVANTMMCLAK